MEKSSDNKNTELDKANNINLKNENDRIIDEKSNQNIDKGNVDLNLDKFYDIKDEKIDLLNAFDKKDDNIIELEKNIELNYKVNEITCGSDYLNNIIIWNRRVLFYSIINYYFEDY